MGLNRIIAISCLIVYLFTTTELHQLLKLPVLAHHYQEHKQIDSDITFWQFMSMHYSQPDDHDADHDKDMKLPFKTDDGCMSFITAVYVAPIVASMPIASTKPVYRSEKKEHFQKQVCLQSSFLASIWQPPRTC